jgi:hypothetical protein
MFRGSSSRPTSLSDRWAPAIERLDTDGTGRAEPANLFSGWGKWSWTDGDRGVQMELVRTTMSRLTGFAVASRSGSRQDLVVRARNRFAPGFTPRSMPGGPSSTRRCRSPRTATRPVQCPSSVRHPGRRTRRVPGAGTSCWAVPSATATRPTCRASRRASTPTCAYRAGPGRRRAAACVMGDADATLYHSLHGELSCPCGASVFGELTGGRRGARLRRSGLVIVTERTGWRAGESLALGERVSGSVAVVGLEQDMAYPFGLPFDTHGATASHGARPRHRSVWPPRRRAGLARRRKLDHRLEPGRRLDVHAASARGGRPRAARAAAAVRQPRDPRADGGYPARGRPRPPRRSRGRVAGFTAIPGYTRIDGYLQIRIIDVRAFIRWEDLTGQEIMDVPGRVLRGPRIFYGVKWNLWN